MRVVTYARISKDREGAGLGVERQRADCAQLAADLGWTVVGEYTDNDISAYSGKPRPGYRAMCEALEAGKAQAVIAWHADRLHRRPDELEPFIDLCDRKGIEVRTVQAGVLDLSTAAGKMVARMLGSVARHEVDHMVERQRRAKKQAALDGKFRGGRRSFGFQSNGMNVHELEATAIREAANALLKGGSLKSIARKWNESGLRTSFGNKEFTSPEVRKILLRPRNAGIALHDGKRLPVGTWEKILDVDTFAAVEAVLRDPTRSKNASFERKHQGSGVYRCGVCGATVIGSAHNKTSSDGWRRAYTCSAAKHVARDVEHLDEYISAVVFERLTQAPISLPTTPGVDVGQLLARREGLRARLDELSDLFADGSIDGSQLKRGTAELRSKLDSVDHQLAAVRSDDALADLVLAGEDLAATWEALVPAARGRIIDALMTVTLMPTRRGRVPGGGYFDPDSVRIAWKPSASIPVTRAS